jgi:hypothetical protein
MLNMGQIDEITLGAGWVDGLGSGLFRKLRPIAIAITNGGVNLDPGHIRTGAEGLSR